MESHVLSIITLFVSAIVMVSRCQTSRPDTPDDTGSIVNACAKICNGYYRCPKPCQALFKDKRIAGGIDGLTFDDYIFMRLLGREMGYNKRLFN